VEALPLGFDESFDPVVQAEMAEMEAVEKRVAEGGPAYVRPKRRKPSDSQAQDNCNAGAAAAAAAAAAGGGGGGGGGGGDVPIDQSEALRVLGLLLPGSEDDIRQAYQKMAKELHEKVEKVKATEKAEEKVEPAAETNKRRVKQMPTQGTEEDLGGLYTDEADVQHQEEEDATDRENGAVGGSFGGGMPGLVNLFNETVEILDRGSRQRRPPPKLPEPTMATAMTSKLAKLGVGSSTTCKTESECAAEEHCRSHDPKSAYKKGDAFVLWSVVQNGHYQESSARAGRPRFMVQGEKAVTVVEVACKDFAALEVVKSRFTSKTSNVDKERWDVLSSAVHRGLGLSTARYGDKEVLEKAPESMVRCLVDIFWDGDQDWFPGKVVSYDGATKKHRVKYLDGDIADEFVTEFRCRLTACQTPVRLTTDAACDESVGERAACISNNQLVRFVQKGKGCDDEWRLWYVYGLAGDIEKNRIETGLLRQTVSPEIKVA
jgi:hypothetical protein